MPAVAKAGVQMRAKLWRARGQIILVVMGLGLAQVTSGVTSAIRPQPGRDFGTRLQEAMILAVPGQVIELPEGRFELSDGLSLDVDGVILRGAGMHKTVLSFQGQRRGSEGLLIMSDQVTVEDFGIEDTRGDGIVARSVKEVTFRRVRTEWTGGPNVANGSYGIYPVQSRDILIEDSVVVGASDAGIYIGQSENVVIRGCHTEYNVAGIEIENSERVDVHQNSVAHNTGGIAVFILPNLPRKTGKQIQILDNKIWENNTPNFSPPGNAVASLAPGTGIHIIAGKVVSILRNKIGQNNTVNIAVMAYTAEFEDKEYNPFPHSILIAGNTHGESGHYPAGELGRLLRRRTGVPVPDIIWDGVVPLREWIFGAEVEERLYLNEGMDTSFANLRTMSERLFPWPVAVDRQMAEYRGTRPLPPSVRLPQDVRTGKSAARKE